jgi:hypothetical protein
MRDTCIRIARADKYVYVPNLFNVCSQDNCGKALHGKIKLIDFKPVKFCENNIWSPLLKKTELFVSMFYRFPSEGNAHFLFYTSLQHCGAPIGLWLSVSPSACGTQLKSE